MSRQARARERLAALRARREAARARLARRRPARRRWPWLLLLLLPLLCLIPDCPPPPDEVATPEPAPQAPAPAGEPPAEPMPVPRMDAIPRPAFRTPPPAPVPWVTALRLQVAARSPRLAECFVGATRPGKLRWSASVEPASGLPSDHSLEPLFQTDGLSRAERDCVLQVLSDPPYQLEHAGERATPSRVGMVLEF